MVANGILGMTHLKIAASLSPLAKGKRVKARGMGRQKGKGQRQKWTDREKAEAKGKSSFRIPLSVNIRGLAVHRS